MMEPSYALQRFIRDRLVNSSAVTSLVTPDCVLDRNDRPETLPASTIVIGEAQVLPDEGLARDRYEVHSDLHLWTEEPGLAVVKTIAGTVRAALVSGPWEVDGYHVADLRITSTRFLRDPGPYGHGVITLSALMKETVS